MLGLVALVLGGGWLYLRASLPQLDGTAAAAGLAQPVKIVRDREGVPHIFAASERDGWFAMGYVHAQDRLWQMEFQRRVAEGRLAEFLGGKAYDFDLLMRTIGIARMAERIVAHLDADTRANLEAYAAGVNAFLATEPVLPVEFQVFSIQPERWKPADTMGWLLVMGWDLSANWRIELARLRFAARLGPKRAAEFMPAYPGEVDPPLPDFHSLYNIVKGPVDRLATAFPTHGQAIGSNSWVVAGSQSVTGKPLLANDPHLALQAPSLWYFAHVATPEGNVVGATLPGVPFIVLGHNDAIAWSMTTTNGDTEDLFVERLVPGDPTRYLTPTGTAKFETHDEVIRVGKEERPIRVRSTRHGPVISDAVLAAKEVAPKGNVIAIEWAGLTVDNAVLRAGFRMNRARNEDEFIAALRDFTAPQQNVVFADRAGHIGFVAPGRIPVRRPDNLAMGRVPVPGWDARYDWQGFLPFEALPQVMDPPEGRIVTANQKITPQGYKPFISVDWYPPYRADRIEELLKAQPKHSLASFAAIQGDDLSYLARELLPVARAAKPTTEAGRRLQARLAGWDGVATMRSAPALAFAAWYRELTRLVYADELGDLFPAVWDLRATFMVAVMKNENGEARWCDDIRTSRHETCDEQAARAFDEAAPDLEKRYGKRWHWGEAHYAAGDHRPFGFVPWLARIFDVSPETSGDGYTVNVGSYQIRDAARPFANTHAPSLRAIYDLADLDRSLFIQSTGQSGNVMSPWYANFAERWAKVQYITIPTHLATIAAAHTLTLEPTAAN